MKVTPPDSINCWRVALPEHLECMTATFQQHAFPRHMHDFFVIEAVAAGADDFECNGRRANAQPGDLVLINPFEVHTGRPAGRAPLSYAAIYPSQAIMSRLARRALGQSAGVPRSTSTVIHDRPTAHTLLDSIAAPRTSNAQAIESLLTKLIEQHAERNNPIPNTSESALERARTILLTRLDQNIPLADLARAVGLSPFHLATQFRLRFGLPPHEFVVNARVERARQLLAAGRSAAEAAARAGFADQPHLTRCFRRRLGITPALYRRKIVQDARRN